MNGANRAVVPKVSVTPFSDPSTDPPEVEAVEDAVTVSDDDAAAEADAAEEDEVSSAAEDDAAAEADEEAAELEALPAEELLPHPAKSDAAIATLRIAVSALRLLLIILSSFFFPSLPSTAVRCFIRLPHIRLFRYICFRLRNLQPVKRKRQAPGAFTSAVACLLLSSTYTGFYTLDLGL